MQVLALLDDMVRQRGMGLILISHDLNLVSSFCDQVLVMYGGQIMERLAAEDLNKAQHPYTQGLMNALPKLDTNEHESQHKCDEEKHRNEIPLEIQQNIGAGHGLQHHAERIYRVLQPQPDKAQRRFMRSTHHLR